MILYPLHHAMSVSVHFRTVKKSRTICHSRFLYFSIKIFQIRFNSPFLTKNCCEQLRAAFRLLFVGFFWHFAVHISKHLCHPHREYFTIAFVWKAIKFAKIPLHLVSLRDSFKWRDYNSLLLFILHNRFDTFKWVFFLTFGIFSNTRFEMVLNLNVWSEFELLKLSWTLLTDVYGGV